MCRESVHFPFSTCHSICVTFGCALNYNYYNYGIALGDYNYFFGLCPINVPITEFYLLACAVCCICRISVSFHQRTENPSDWDLPLSVQVVALQHSSSKRVLDAVRGAVHIQKMSTNTAFNLTTTHGEFRRSRWLNTCLNWKLYLWLKTEQTAEYNHLATSFWGTDISQSYRLPQSSDRYWHQWL